MAAGSTGHLGNVGLLRGGPLGAILVVVKALAALATMGFGLYGLGVELRHKEGVQKGQFTKQGSIALVGVLLSGILSFVVVIIAVLRGSTLEPFAVIFCGGATIRLLLARNAIDRHWRAARFHDDQIAFLK